MSSGFIHVAASDRLSPFLKCITKFLDRFICLLTFGLFWPLVAVNNTSVNSGVFVSVWIPAVIFFGCRPWSTIAGWHGNSIFNFSRKKLKLFLILHTVFCNGRAVSITTHVYRIQSLHPSHTHFLFWDSGHPLWGWGSASWRSSCLFHLDDSDKAEVHGGSYAPHSWSFQGKVSF